MRSPAVVVLTAVVASAQTFAPDRLFEADSRMIRVSFSRDGNTVVGTSQDGTARAWDVKSGALLRTVQWTGDFPFGVAIAPGGDVLAAGVRPQMVNVWDLTSGRIINELSGHVGFLDDAVHQFSRDGALLATSSQGQARLWELPSGRLRFDTTAGDGAVVSFSFSPDNQMLAGANEDTNVRVWSVRDGRELQVIGDQPLLTTTLAFSADGKQLIAGNLDRQIYVWDTATWRRIRRFGNAPEAIYSLDLSPNGRLVATGGLDPNGMDLPAHLVVWDLASGKALRTIRLPHSANQVAFSPDGSVVAVANLAAGVKLWRVSELLMR